MWGWNRLGTGFREAEKAREEDCKGFGTAGTREWPGKD